MIIYVYGDASQNDAKRKTYALVCIRKYQLITIRLKKLVTFFGKFCVSGIIDKKDTH